SFKDRGRTTHALARRLLAERRGAGGGICGRAAGRRETVGLQGRGRIRASDRPRGRTAALPSAAQSGRQRHQVHRQGRSGNPGISHERSVHGFRFRYWSWYRRSRSGEDLRGISPGRQFDHAREGRDRLGPLDRQAHHRDARWAHLGRVRARQGIEVLFHAAGAGRSRSGAALSKRILVIEDQEDNRQILRDFLSNADFAVIEAVDGEAGLAGAAAHQPDLILMDIQLPGIDGYEATRRLKADTLLRAIPVIAVTSYALGGDADKARAAGCDAYIS